MLVDGSANNGQFQQYCMQNDTVRGNTASNIAVLQYVPEDNDEYNTVHYTKNGN